LDFGRLRKFFFTRNQIVLFLNSRKFFRKSANAKVFVKSFAFFVHAKVSARESNVI